MLLLAGFLLLGVMANPAMAQQVTSAIGGQVVDQNGAPVPGATIRIVHEPTGTIRSAETRSNGRFSATGLRTGGPYTVSASRDGFQSQELENVFLRLGETQSLNFEISDRIELDRLAVTGQVQSATFQPDNMGTGTTIGSDQIENFASISRSINDYIRLDPRATVIDSGRNELSVGGGHNRYNNLMIDGVPANDAFGLNADSQPSVRQPLSIEWIREIAVNTSPYDASQTGGTGSIINSVTKSGTNEFSGSVYGVYRDQKMIGDDDAGNSFPDFEEYSYGFTLGGPIVKDRLFFFLGYEYNREDDADAAQVGVQGDSVATIFQTPREDIEEIIAIAAGYGLDAGQIDGPGALTEDQKNVLMKLDWDINAMHRANLRYNYSDGDSVSIGRSATFFPLTNTFYTQNIQYEGWSAQLFSDWTPNFSTEFRATTTNYEARFDLPVRAPQVNIDTDGGIVRIGTEQFRHANELDFETTNLFAKGNYFLGNHSVDFGIDYGEESYNNLFVESSLGRYAFDSIEDFANGSTGVQYTLRSSANPEDPGFPAAVWEWDYTGLFAQDTWQVNPSLSLMFGARWETFGTGDEPIYNPLFEETFGFSNTGNIDGSSLFQPRLGFNYQPMLDFNAQLRGGVGLFRGRSPGVWLSNPYTNPGGTIDVFTCDSRGQATGCTDLDPNFGFNANPDAQPRLGGTTPAQDVDVMEDGFRLPSDWKANLAWDMEIPGVENALVGLEVEHTWVNDGIHYEHLNLGDPTGQLPDGRDAFWADINTGSGSRANRDPVFNDVIFLRNTSKGERTNFTLTGEKQWEGSWGKFLARGGYNRQRARDVNPGTSSRAVSNWVNHPVFNANEEVEANSIYGIRDRFTLQATYEARLFDFGPTRLTAFWENRDGRRFSYGFINDASGDGSNHDLLYVPNGPGDVIFVDGNGNPDPGAEAAFLDLVNSIGSLRNNQGQVVGRNTETSSRVNQIDIRIAQDFDFGRYGGQLYFDIQNVGNLINSSWGQIDQVGFPFVARVARFEGVDEDTGRYIYNYDGRADFDSRQDGIGQSRWRAQIGARFRF